MDSRDRRIVLLGKTGAGRSSAGNTIFGEEVFKADVSSSSFTETCTRRSRIIDGREITLIDTPGFFDTKISEDELRPKIIKSITECAAGVHAFLIVLKVERFTDYAKKVSTKVLNYFSNKALKYATVLFTHGYQLKGKPLRNYVEEHKELRELVQKCGGRCHVIDNEFWNQGQQDKNRSNQVEVSKLLKTIDQMVEQNRGGCYTNEMLQAVEEDIQAEEKTIIDKSGGKLSEEEINKQAKQRKKKAVVGGVVVVVVVLAVVIIIAVKAFIK